MVLKNFPYQINDKSKLSIRKGTWPVNEGIYIDQIVIEKTIKKLELKICPVCKGDLESQDQFNTSLQDPGREETEFRYCPKDNYIIDISGFLDR